MVADADGWYNTQLAENKRADSSNTDRTLLNAQYTVKIQNGEHVSGFGLASYPHDGGVQSDFIILADKFAIVTPTANQGETPQVPFIVGNIEGVPTVGINGQLVIDGTLYADAIAANEITADKMNVTTLSSMTADIGELTSGLLRFGVDLAQRFELTDSDSYYLWAGDGTKNDTNADFYIKDDGSIKTGKLIYNGATDILTIGNNVTIAASGNATFTGALSAASGTYSGVLTASAINAVNTINIAGQAVTIPVAGSSGAIGVTYQQWSNLLTLGMTGTGSPVFVDCNTMFGNTVFFDGNGFLKLGWIPHVRVLRNGAVWTATYQIANNFNLGIVDTAAAGYRTYTIQAYGFAYNTALVGPTNYTIANYMSLLEVKR